MVGCEVWNSIGGVGHPGTVMSSNLLPPLRLVVHLPLWQYSTSFVELPYQRGWYSKSVCDNHAILVFDFGTAFE